MQLVLLIEGGFFGFICLLLAYRLLVCGVTHTGSQVLDLDRGTGMLYLGFHACGDLGHHFIHIQRLCV